MSRSGSRAQTLKRKVKRKIRAFRKNHPGVHVAILLIITAGIGFCVYRVFSDKDTEVTKPVFRENVTKPTDSEYDDNNMSDGNQGDYVTPTKRDYILCFIDGVTKVDKLPESSIESLATSMDTNPASVYALVNKMYPMSSEYQPEDLVEVNVKFTFNYKDEKRMLRKEAAHALECMFEAATEDGIELLGVSGYRSFLRQQSIYNNNLSTKGYEHTNSYSARPGRSEHQTGWSIDISSESADGKLIEEFIETVEGQWVKNNSYKFGFIVRYPKGKEDITGYSYEPWHVRYVGYDLAKYLYDNNMTLDEYYGYKADLEAIEAEEWQYYIDYINSLSTPTPTPTEEPIVSPTPSVDVTPEATISVPPTQTPTIKPTQNPTVTPKPEDKPTSAPATMPPATNTPQPSSSPTEQPTAPPVTPEPPVEESAQ